MSEHVNRHAGWDGVAMSVGRFLADPNWRPAFEAIACGSNEEKILKLLKAKLKEAGAAKYLPDFAIRKPREDRIKMRLILGTHSAHGVEVFRTVQEKVEREGFRVRENIKTVETGQMSLSNDLFIALDATLDGVGCADAVTQAGRIMIKTVSSQPGIAFAKMAPDVMAQVPVRTTHLNSIVMKQRNSGLLRFDLPPRKRTPQPETKLYPPVVAAV